MEFTRLLITQLYMINLTRKSLKMKYTKIVLFLRQSHAMNICLLSLLTITCYLNALKGDLVFDDVIAIKENRDLRSRTPFINLFYNDFWGTPIRKEESHKSYRPLCTLTFRLNYALHGLDPFGYHLVNVILHCLVSFLFYRICLYFLRRRSSFISAVLFVVHPIHTEAVTGVVGRAELLSAFFYLSALHFYIKQFTNKSVELSTFSGTLSAIVLTIAGTLCKEQCLTVLPICAIYDVTLVIKKSRNKFSRRNEPLNKIYQSAVIRLGMLSVSLASIISCRLWIIGSNLPIFSRFDNPASVSPFPTRVMTYNFLLALNSWLLLFPSSLCCDWSMETTPLVHDSTDIRNISTAVFYTVLGLLLLKTFVSKLNATSLMGLSMLVLPFIPASNLIIPVGFVLAERVLYLPSMGFSILVAYGYELINKYQRKNICNIFMTIVIVSYATKTVTRNEDWKSEKSLYEAGLKVSDRNLKLLNNYGRALENLGRHEEALIYYTKSIQIEPRDVRGYLNYGKALSFLGRYTEAEEIFLQAKSLVPVSRIPLPLDLRLSYSHLNVFLNLAALIARNQSRFSEADEVFREALELRSDFTKAYVNRGQLLKVMNKSEEAELMYSRAIRDEKSNPDLYNNYGQMLLDSGRTNEALTYFTKALEIDPDHENTLLNLAFFVQESRSSWAKSFALHKLDDGASRRESPSETLSFRIGMAFLAHNDKPGAEKWFRKAIKTEPTFRSALYNLALLLSEQNRPKEAIVILRKLFEHHPDHVKGLFLLGDLHVNHERNLTVAQQCYERILNLEPSNVKASHNLCVVFMERGNLSEAERCLNEADGRHPDVEYIKNNLNTIRSLQIKYNGT